MAGAADYAAPQNRMKPTKGHVMASVSKIILELHLSGDVPIILAVDNLTGAIRCFWRCDAPTMLDFCNCIACPDDWVTGLHLRRPEITKTISRRAARSREDIAIRAQMFAYAFAPDATHMLINVNEYPFMDSSCIDFVPRPSRLHAVFTTSSANGKLVAVRDGFALGIADETGYHALLEQLFGKLVQRWPGPGC